MQHIVRWQSLLQLPYFIAHPNFPELEDKNSLASHQLIAHRNELMILRIPSIETGHTTLTLLPLPPLLITISATGILLGTTGFSSLANFR